MKALARISILSALIATLFTGACATIVDTRPREPAMMSAEQENELFNIQLSLLSLQIQIGEQGVSWMQSGTDVYPFLGIGVQSHFDETGHTRLVRVFPGLPAWNAGLRTGDLITAVAGVDVCSGGYQDPEEAKWASCGNAPTLIKAAPDTFTIVVERIEEHQRLVLSVVLTKAPIGKDLATAVAVRMPEWEAHIRAHETIVRDFWDKLEKVRGEQRPLSEAEMEALKKEAAAIQLQVNGPFAEFEGLKSTLLNP